MDPKVWQDMFVLTLPVLEKILRPIIVYVFLVVGLRLAGKRELAQLNPFDLVVLLTLSNTVQNAIIGEDNSVSGGLIGATTLLAVNFVVVRFLYSHERLERVVAGDSDVLIEDGLIKPTACGTSSSPCRSWRPRRTGRDSPPSPTSTARSSSRAAPSASWPRPPPSRRRGIRSWCDGSSRSARISRRCGGRCPPGRRPIPARVIPIGGIVDR